MGTVVSSLDIEKDANNSVSPDDMIYHAKLVEKSSCALILSLLLSFPL
jgi:hypothetical protein